MRYSRNTYYLVFMSILAILVVACSPAGTATVEATEVVDDTVESTEPVMIAQDGAVGEAIPGLLDGQHLLAWLAPADRSGNHSASSPGELVLFKSDGSTESLLTLPEGTTSVRACGPNSSSQDGTTFAFHVADATAQSGTLYLLHASSSELMAIDESLHPIGCVGSSPFQFSDDGSTFAYIDWNADATTVQSPFGFLRIHDTASGDEIASFENVTTFDLTSEGAVWVNFFVNDDREATEVGITTWDGNVDIEVSTLVGDEENDCFYISASVTETDNGLMAVMGYRCNRGNNTATQWEFYNIDTANRAAQLEATDTSVGNYFVFSDTNAIFASPDGSNIIYSVPDGISNRTASLFGTTVNSVEPTIILERYGVMPSVSDLPYDANNATAKLSPDGRYFAIVGNDVGNNNSATLYVFDLNDVSVPPITLDAGDQGDTIGDMVFNLNSDTLYYVAGTDEGGNNSLYALDLTTGTEARVRRGRFAQMVVSPDNSTIAVMNWVEFDPAEPRYLTLEVIDIASTAPTTIYVGGEITDDNELINPSFAYPLTWIAEPAPVVEEE